MADNDLVQHELEHELLDLEEEIKELIRKFAPRGGGGGGAGATTFLGLTDTPGSYAGSGSLFVRVNAGETGLEFAVAGGGVNIGDAIGSGTAGSVLFVDPSGDLGQDNANLFWDDSSNFLGVGQGTPASTLHVGGDFALDGATSGTLTQLAASTTTDYSLTWPAAQATGTQVLTNDGAGNLSWTTNAAAIGIGDTVTSGTPKSILYIDGSTQLAEDPGSFEWDETLNTMGIGTTAQTDRTVAIADTWDHTSGIRYGVNARITVDPTANSTGTTESQYQTAVDSANTFDVGTVRGFNNQARHDGAGTVNVLTGGLYQSINGGTGTVDNARAIDTVLSNTNASGTITNGFSINVAAPTTTGAITNTRGVYIQNQGTANVTAARGIHIEAISGATSENTALRVDGGDVAFNEDGTDSDLKVEGLSDPSLLFVDASSDTVGVGIAVPNADSKLNVFHSSTATSGSVLGAALEARVSSSAGPANTANVFGNNYLVALTGSDDYTGIIDGGFGIADHGGTGTVTTIIGHTASASLSSTGGVTTGAGAAFSTGNTGGGTMTTGNAIIANPPTGTGTITTQNGLLIGNQGRSGITDARGLRIEGQSGASSENVAISLGGSTSGTLTIDVPAAITDYDIVLPDSVGSANDALKTDASGNLFWQEAVFVGQAIGGSTANRVLFSNSVSNISQSVGLQYDDINRIFSVRSTSGVTPISQVVGSTVDPKLILAAYGSTGDFTTNKANGTEGSPTTVADNDVLGVYTWSGHDGTGNVQSSRIRAEVDGTVSTGVVPGRLRFMINDTGGVARDILRLGSSITTFNLDGQDRDLRIEGSTDVDLFYVDAGSDTVGIGTATPTDKLHVDGSIGMDGSTSGTFSQDAPATVTSYTVTWPDAVGADDQILVTDSSGDLRWENSVPGVMTLTPIITPAAFTAHQNDWSPTGLSTTQFIRASATANYDLTGIVAQQAGRMIYLANVGTANNIRLMNENASSSAANRFALRGNINIEFGEGVLLVYDGTSSRWRMVGGI